MVLGRDAQVEFQADAGCGLCGGKTKNIHHNNLEVQLEAEFAIQRLTLIKTCMDWTQTQKTLSGADHWQTVEQKDQLKRWKVLDYVAIPQGWTGRSVVWF